MAKYTSIVSIYLSHKIPFAASTFLFTFTILSHTVGNLAIRNSLFSELQVLLSFLKVMQNSSRFTNVSLLGKSELVTPTLFI